MMLNSPLQPCDTMPWNSHCIPEAYLPHTNTWVLVLLLIFACLSLAVLIHQAFTRSAWWKNLTLQNSRAAAERISDALRALPLLQGDPLRSVCKSIANDLLLVIDFTLVEAGRYGSAQSEETDSLEAIHNVRREAFKLREPVIRALLLLRFRSQPATAQRLILEATAHYISAVIPAVRELHRRQTDSCERIPVFEIKLPNGCEI
jgi:hypothetical protein